MARPLCAGILDRLETREVTARLRRPVGALVELQRLTPRLHGLGMKADRLLHEREIEARLGDVGLRLHRALRGVVRAQQMRRAVLALRGDVIRGRDVAHDAAVGAREALERIDGAVGAARMEREDA